MALVTLAACIPQCRKEAWPCSQLGLEAKCARDGSLHVRASGYSKLQQLSSMSGCSVSVGQSSGRYGEWKGGWMRGRLAAAVDKRQQRRSRCQGAAGSRQQVVSSRSSSSGNGGGAAALVEEQSREEKESEAAEWKERRGLRGKTEADVIVIGSGIGGLSAAAMSARYGLDVLVLESHSIPGGAAHGFSRQGFKFDSGPSLFSGLNSRGPQANPLAQVLDAVGERVACSTYDSWMCYLPEGSFQTRIGPTQFFEVLEKYAGGQAAVEDWRKLLAVVEPLSGAAMALPPAAIRSDALALLTAGLRYGPSVLGSFLQMGPAAAANAGSLLGPFSEIVATAGIKDRFVTNWVDLLSFLLSGQKADATIAAEIVYMFGEWYKPGCVLEYPLGGSEAIIAALIRGIEQHKGQLSLGCHVGGVLVEGGEARGVRLRDGQVVKARKAVISNASVWDTMRLLPAGSVPLEYRQAAEATPECDSFMHLHIGFDAKDAHSDLEIHHIVVNDWSVGVDAPQNVVLISIPSVLDPSLAPAGCHCLHAYTPGTEPASVWTGMDRGSAEYRELKEQRSQVLWEAVQRVLGPNFSREKCHVALTGSPLTHGSYLRRHNGTYGPAIPAGRGTFPGATTPIAKLLCCGDSTFPGIGVPAVAASGLVAANTLANVWDHWRMLDEIGV